MRSVLAVLWFLFLIVLLVAMGGGLVAALGALEPHWSDGALYAAAMAITVLLLVAFQRWGPPRRARRASTEQHHRDRGR